MYNLDGNNSDDVRDFDLQNGSSQGQIPALTDGLCSKSLLVGFPLPSEEEQLET